MALPACAQCGTPIMDRSVAVVRGEQEFCCPNCATLARGGTAPSDELEECAHCASPLVNTTTRVAVEGDVYCCVNCAIAEQGGPTSLRGGSGG